MARRALAVVGNHVNGHVNGDAPPSTLAAQLVQQQSRQDASQHLGGVATFQELLHEILHNDSAVQETDVNVNVQLISVVTQMGLEPITKDNPFSNWDVLIPQAVNSIAVIEKTIVRQPDVLLAQAAQDGPQIFLTLLTTLLAACGPPKCRELPIPRLLSSALAALSKSSHLWQQALVLQEVIRECVDDTLSALEALPTPNAALNLRLPPARSVGKLWPSSENSITVPNGSTTTINDISRAFIISFDLSGVQAFSAAWERETQRRLQILIMRFRPQLEQTGLWEQLLNRLLRSFDCWPLLPTLLQEIARNSSSNSVQTGVGRALLETLRYHSGLAADALMPCLRNIASGEAWNGLHGDLKIAITTWLCRFDPEDDLPQSAIDVREAFRQGNFMSDNDLQAAFKQLSVFQSPIMARSRRRKRRRISAEASDTKRTAAMQLASRLLTGIETTDLSTLPEVASSVYATLDEDNKCTAWQSLVDLATHDLPTTLQTVSKLIELPELNNTQLPRVLSVLAVQACVERTADADYTSLGHSQFGKYCLTALHSSTRNLRIAGGNSLPSFLREDLPEEVRTQNRQLALEYLRTLSDRNAPNEHETLIAAWGQVAVACGERELNLVLLRLVDYLGHGNPLVAGLAFAEIEAIAAVKSMSTLDLFRPFWRSVAVFAVQELNVNPQKTQRLCEVLHCKDVASFLKMTQQDTLPALVLTKKRDIIQRIADTRGEGTSVRQVCLSPLANLASILTSLLTQSPSADIEESASACLIEVDPELKRWTLHELIKQDPALIAAEVLKYCGEESDNRKSRAYQGFYTLASIEQAPNSQRKAKSRDNRSVAAFFEGHILGIIAHFSTRLEENKPTTECLAEKVRCLKGLAEVFVLSKGSVSKALPQIRACLQCGLEQPELTELAFSNWLALLPLLEEADIKGIIDEFLVLVVRHWSTFSADLQRRTHDMIADLIHKHQKMLQDNLMMLPSLAGIPLLSKFAAEFERLKDAESTESHCTAFTTRLRDDTDTVVLQALHELVPFLETRQDFVHDTASSEQPSPVLSELICALLDVTVKYSGIDDNTAILCGKALGIIGALDPNRVEANRKKRQLLVLSNFDKANETIDWIMALFEDVLVKAFKSVTNVRTQGFLAFTMQELLKACSLNEQATFRTRASQAPLACGRWNELPEHIRTTLTPFLSSHYTVTSNSKSEAGEPRVYPSFTPDASPSQWLRSLTGDLLLRANGDNAKEIFPLLARTVRGHDMAIGRFVFPFAVLNVVLGGTVAELQGLAEEFLAVLNASPATPSQQETIRLCSETVFSVLDYLSTWLREKRKELSETRAAAYKTGHSPNEFDEARDMGQIETVEAFFALIPAEIIARQAMECRSYARALFHWEQYIRQARDLIPSGRLSEKEDGMYDRLQEIYSQIDEPDGLEGIAAHLPIISEDQQAFNHAKSGRWAAAQAWYELQLAEQPDVPDLQHNVLRCLQETGQYTPLLKYAETFLNASRGTNEKRFTTEMHLPLAAEACWMTENLNGLEKVLSNHAQKDATEFNVGIGQCLLRAADVSEGSFLGELQRLRKSITESLSMAGTDTLQNCHSELRNLHVIYELEALMNADAAQASTMLQAFDKRLAAMGSYIHDKQYVLGIRRAAMRLRPEAYKDSKIGASWLTTAKLARQAKNISSAYNAVLKAAEYDERGAKLEQARLLWHEGHQRQAIQALEAAIQSGIFVNADPEGDTPMSDPSVSVTKSDEINGYRQDPLEAKALLILAKWLDASGQSQTKDMTDRYQLAARRYQRWEKGHYYLGKHYSKLLDAQKALPKNKQAAAFLTGELSKLVIDNSLRSIPFGNKYWHETIPRVLTLWLELGMEARQKNAKEEQATFDKRVKSLQQCNKQLQKYFDRVPPYVFYHALPQLISRVTHPHPDIWKQLSNILTRIGASHPSQALWSIFPMTKAEDPVRVERGVEILSKIKDPKNKPKTADSSIDLRVLIQHGQKLCDSLLQASERPVEPRKVQISLAKDLAFNHKLAPSQLVVPIQATLIAAPPAVTTSEAIRKHRAFTQEKIIIQGFSDEVLVLNSLQRPRKITIRGSDGKFYGLLCKPKDDLRKDQRLMEFNGIINRALKRDTESSKRRLYIKTYAVTPLSEESGCIEWVEGITPLRDILLGLYNRKGIRPNYAEIKKDLDVASAAPENAPVFAKKVLSQFPPALHEWFTETYPEPDTWFAARLRYARSAAVMSMTGHVLGLGDRHGENILLEESTGGVFHVDFNCLFDKGLTFEKPEMVPFRLTPNMQDAMGPYGHEGPFRKSSELTLGLLRQERDTLMTVLETFLYDPTTDFVGKKKRSTVGVPETPAEILESVDTKLRGLLRGETVPLSVEGYVDALIQQATSHFRLASMYIGWCSFL
ncbi:kinase rad3 [Lecanosticta acicola]|uniref:non-specific serine/threonine protein kinase n=1 Tax=Lecanosticta acicola TaxID=111012 RepID=A0AAI9E7P3_9PEZI|nr:kinase rad3 [Lecanosticta acicola]